MAEKSTEVARNATLIKGLLQDDKNLALEIKEANLIAM